MSRFLVIAFLISSVFSSAYAFTNKNINLKSELGKHMWNQGLTPLASAEEQDFDQYLSLVETYEKQIVANENNLPNELSKALNAIK